MPPETHRQSLRPSKSSARSRQTAKSHGQNQDGSKPSQPGTLLFIDVSDPTESKRQDRRKAVRSFVMKQYRQSQKTAEPVRTQDEELDNECEIDATQESPGTASSLWAENVSDSSHLSFQSTCDSRDTDDVFLASTQQLSVSSPDSENAADPNGPLSILGNGSLDPFDSYPARIEMQAHQIIDLYLNTEGIFPESQTFNRDSRRKTWFPLMCTSKALFHGLIASAASACAVQQIGEFEPLVLRHQHNSLKALNETLSNDLCVEESTATIFAIKTLLLVAMHERNAHAIKMHFQGAVAVVHKSGSPYKMGRLAQQVVASFACWTSFAPPNTLLIPFAELVWSSSVHPFGRRKDASSAKPVDDPLSTAVAGTAPASALSMHETYDNAYIPSELGLVPETRYSRNLSPPLLEATQRITDLSLLARRARSSPLSLQEQAELLAGICCGGQELASLSPDELSPLEDCIRMTTLIHFFADVVPFEEGDEPRITHLTESVEKRISTIDLEFLLNEWPEVGLWIAIVVGVFAKEETWSFFQDLLRLFSGRLKILSWDDVISVLDEFQPISSQPFLRCCKAFWLGAMALKSVQIALGQMSRRTAIASDIPY